MKKDSSLWVVIPAYNEAKRIGPVLKETKKYSNNIVVVDDGSKDNTFSVAKKTGVVVLQNIINMGKGAALKTGCDFALKQGAKKIVVMDSDGQHDPKKIPEFVELLDKADIVFGYRRFNKDMPFVLKFGNEAINTLVSFLYGLKLRDTQSGYRGFTASAYRKVRWKASDYSMETEMIANAGKRHLKYEEIPIKTIYLDRYKGTTIIDGVKIVINMLLWRLKR